MINIRRNDRMNQQRLDQELKDVLMDIGTTTRSITRHLHMMILSGQRKSKGANYDK